ncbi:hypothetical protein [Amphiplicatus metriothermophilus]|uniref:Uncharacterized protein n=1 Tax=Amphiplicatus metriothermophilus TaxID=1519374 RepID=A0A239PKY4_9PROT|nr:hypothetical protein [Amphiplicatus metriothermophilus]MBB5517953.1 hypothetical protein [Amphiplicatus metriothermophilus]SNT67714.1 hypothetical protein SAMN06297382_0207 [Amphiplicatus metriothermophilus]
MKKTLAGFAAAAALAAAAFASDFGPTPVNYEQAAETYISERLVDPRGARVQIVGEPYQVYADVAGYEGLPCWAIDVRVKARLPNGTSGGYVPYTVLFLDGEPIALKEDARRLVRL